VINLQAGDPESLVSLLKIFTQSSCWLEESKNCARCPTCSSDRGIPGVRCTLEDSGKGLSCRERLSAGGSCNELDVQP
jgi:hypothetical protein